MKNKIMFLTSTGLTSLNILNKFKEYVVSPESKAVAIITTAAEGKENNKYSILAKKQFEDMGYLKVDFLDLEMDQDVNISEYSVVYVCGGNTFKLLKYAREANFKNKLENFLDNDGVYVGVSAGSIMVGPSIQIAEEIAGDENFVNLTDMTGLNIIDLIILPHYDSSLEIEVKKFELENKVSVCKLSNSEAVIVENKIEKID